MTDKYTTRSGSSRHYEVRVSGLPSGPAEITLDNDRWNRTSRGDSIAVEYHPGALGYPWMITR
ncbi:MAG: hypothetical protein LC689_16010 [Myxococcales bacterium]|nr:hypothetical protein [Myxococcales bacterium]